PAYTALSYFALHIGATREQRSSGPPRPPGSTFRGFKEERHRKSPAISGRGGVAVDLLRAQTLMSALGRVIQSRQRPVEIGWSPNNDQPDSGRAHATGMVVCLWGSRRDASWHAPGGVRARSGQGRATGSRGRQQGGGSGRRCLGGRHWWSGWCIQWRARRRRRGQRGAGEQRR